MTKRNVLIAGMALILFACLSPSTMVARFSPAASPWTDSVLATLTLRDRAAQLVWPQIFGDYSPATGASWERIREWTVRERVGGFIMSVGSPLETAVKLNAMQRLSVVPLLIASDYETGAGFRTRGGYFLPNAINLGGATIFAPQMALGATRDTALAYQQGAITAREARALGVHVVFAPVMDVNNNAANPVIGARSFGEDPELVSAMGTALIRGMQDHGVIATAKHFPGHGDTETNSHLAIATVRGTRQRLDSIELLPFRRAISADVGGIMTFHGILPALDTTPVPATLSSRIMTELVRTELGFKGLVVTDAMDMTGVLAQVRPGRATRMEAGVYADDSVPTMGIAEVAVQAVLAGNDILLMPTDVPGAIDALVGAVRSGRLSQARLDASVRRVLALKEKLGLSRATQVSVDSLHEVVGDSSHVAAAQRIASRSITLAKDSLGVVPLPATARRVLSITIANRTDLAAGVTFNAELRRGVPMLQTEYVDPAHVDISVDRIAGLAASSDFVIVGSYLAQGATVATTAVPTQLLSLVHRLVRSGKPVIAVAFGNPYLLRDIPEVPAYLLAWGPFPVSQRAAAAALLGETALTGRMPISIPPYVAFGAGVRRSATKR